MEATLLELFDKVKTFWADAGMGASEAMVVVLLIAVVVSAELDFSTAAILVAAVAVFIWHSIQSRTIAPAVTVPLASATPATPAHDATPSAPIAAPAFTAGESHTSVPMSTPTLESAAPAHATVPSAPIAAPAVTAGESHTSVPMSTPTLESAAPAHATVHDVTPSVSGVPRTHAPLQDNGHAESPLSMSNMSLSMPAPPRHTIPTFTPTPLQLSRFKPLLDRLDQCGMATIGLTPQQVSCLEIMAATRKDHSIVSVCKFITCSFVAKVKCGADLSHLCVTDSATVTKAKANALVKGKILVFNGAIKQCITANLAKKDRFVSLGTLRTNINHLGWTWSERLELWNQQFGHLMVGATVKSVDDTTEAGAVFSAGAVRLRDKIYTDVGKKLEELIKHTENLNRPMGVLFREETMKSSQSLMEGIVHNSFLSKVQKENLAEAIKVCDKFFKRMYEACIAVERAQASAEDLSEEHKDAQRAVNRQIASVQADIDQAANIKSRHGQGYWRMRGAPNDEQSRKLKGLWDQDQVSQLFDYTSGKFECRFVSELTDSQKEVRALQTTLAQDMKEFQLAKDELKEKKQQVVVRNAEVLRLRELFDSAKADYKTAETAMKVGSSTLPPAQAAEVSGLLRVAEAMSGTAGRFAPCDEEIAEYEGTLQDLKIMIDAKMPVQIVLVYVRRLQEVANATQESNMVLLSNLGTVLIGEFLLPNQDPGVADDLAYWKDETEQMGIAGEDVHSKFEAQWHRFVDYLICTL